MQLQTSRFLYLIFRERLDSYEPTWEVSIEVTSALNFSYEPSHRQ